MYGQGEKHLISSSSRKTNNCPGKVWHEGTKSSLETKDREADHEGVVPTRSNTTVVMQLYQIVNQLRVGLSRL